MRVAGSWTPNLQVPLRNSIAGRVNTLAAMPVFHVQRGPRYFHELQRATNRNIRYRGWYFITYDYRGFFAEKEKWRVQAPRGNSRESLFRFERTEVALIKSISNSQRPSIFRRYPVPLFRNLIMNIHSQLWRLLPYCVVLSRNLIMNIHSRI